MLSTKILYLQEYILGKNDEKHSDECLRQGATYVAAYIELDKWRKQLPLKKELKKIEEELDKSFEDCVKEALIQAEEDSYDPFEKRTKEEIQRKYVRDLAVHYDDYRNELIYKMVRIVREIERIEKWGF